MQLKRFSSCLALFQVLQEQGLGKYCDPEFVRAASREMQEAMDMTQVHTKGTTTDQIKTGFFTNNFTEINNFKLQDLLLMILIISKFHLQNDEGHQTFYQNFEKAANCVPFLTYLSNMIQTRLIEAAVHEAKSDDSVLLRPVFSNSA